MKNKHDPRNHTKRHESITLDSWYFESFRGTSCHFVGRLTAPIAAHDFLTLSLSKFRF
jgi:hypothetical protein